MLNLTDSQLRIVMAAAQPLDPDAHCCLSVLALNCALPRAARDPTTLTSPRFSTDAFVGSSRAQRPNGTVARITASCEAFWD
jgi:hypothetical protein